MKIILISLLCLFKFTIHGQSSTIDAETEIEIHEFVIKETRQLKELKLKKYYKNFSKKNFIQLFEDENLDRKKKAKWAKKYLKRRDKKKLELLINAPFEEFYNAFNLHILSEKDLENDAVKAPITERLGQDITKSWNPKVAFTKDRYLVCLLPKFDRSQSTVPKYGEFMILQIIEKEGKNWKVYASYQ